MRGPIDYTRCCVDPAASAPAWATDAEAKAHDLLVGCAIAFAERCRQRPNPKFPRDCARRAELRYGRGLGADEAAAFLRALRSDLATVAADGAFFVPGRACSPNLHLVGRNEDHVAMHTEVLVHVGVYAELVLDYGWEPKCLAFDPFTRGAALDLWGFNDGPDGDWWEGKIVFVAEAKARVSGKDSLTGLVSAFERLRGDPNAVVHPGHRRKWDELTTIVANTEQSNYCLPPTARAGGGGTRWPRRPNLASLSKSTEPGDGFDHLRGSLRPALPSCHRGCPHFGLVCLEGVRTRHTRPRL